MLFQKARRASLDSLLCLADSINQQGTWTEGRNMLLQEVYAAERYRGYHYDFVLMLDDDINLHCREHSSGKCAFD